MTPKDRNENFSFHRVRFMYTTNRTWRRIATAALVALLLSIAAIIGFLVWYFLFRVPDGTREQRDSSVTPESGVQVSQYNGCFPPSAVVTTPAGPEPIDQLRLGDRVLDSGGWTSVYAFSFLDHQHRTLTEITTSDGHRIRLTPNHLIFHLLHRSVKDIPAGRVTAGHLLVTTNGTSRVTGVRSVPSRGARSPLTASGSLLVDGVWVSCYTGPWMGGRVGHASVHFALAPLRGLASILNIAGPRTLNEYVLIPDHYHLWYVRLLKLVHSFSSNFW